MGGNVTRKHSSLPSDASVFQQLSAEPDRANRTAFIICGALAREVLAIIQRHNWPVDVVGISAMDHMYPERIAPDVEKQILKLRDQYRRVIVVFGDCGSRGALDALLERHGIDRIASPHCYEMYAGQGFHDLMDEEPGTFFLTDFLVRGFQGTVMKGLGLDRFPQLKEDYFRHYKRLVYLVQLKDPDLLARAEQISDYLELPLEIRHTEYGLLEQRLMELMDGQEEKK
jgi:hypothetical protein